MLSNLINITQVKAVAKDPTKNCRQVVLQTQSNIKVLLSGLIEQLEVPVYKSILYWSQ